MLPIRASWVSNLDTMPEHRAVGGDRGILVRAIGPSACRDHARNPMILRPRSTQNYRTQTYVSCSSGPESCGPRQQSI